MNPSLNFSIRQKIPFGELVFHLSQEEIAILQLISCENEDALPHWIKLWENVSDYEDLLFSCKELMPSAVHKIQSCCDENTWKKYIPAQADFLAGLPRFTWTKNQYIINQYKKIASALEDAHIEFIALKGVCEMLDGNTLALMRTSRDIDLLIHENDWEACKIVFENLGWTHYAKPYNFKYLNSPIKSHAETFYNHERIFDLDVHKSAIPSTDSVSKSFNERIWKNKVESKSYPNLHIPSKEDRFLITIANAHRLYNWERSHTSKYMYDLLAISNGMEDGQISQAACLGKTILNFGDNVSQYLNLIEYIKNSQILPSRNKANYKLNYSVGNKALTQVIRFQVFIQLSRHLIQGSKLIHVSIFMISKIFILSFKILYSFFQIKKIHKIGPANSKPIFSKQFSIHLFAK
jgi:hypothetical protein